jgi:hypothetical protein
VKEGYRFVDCDMHNVMLALTRGYNAEAQVIGMEMEGIDIAVLFPTAGLSFITPEIGGGILGGGARLYGFGDQPFARAAARRRDNIATGGA